MSSALIISLALSISTPRQHLFITNAHFIHQRTFNSSWTVNNDLMDLNSSKSLLIVRKNSTSFVQAVSYNYEIYRNRKNQTIYISKGNNFSSNRIFQICRNLCRHWKHHVEISLTVTTHSHHIDCSQWLLACALRSRLIKSCIIQI